MTITQRSHVMDAIGALQAYDTLMRQYTEVQVEYMRIRVASPEALIRCAQMAEAGVRGNQLRVAMQEAKKLERSLQVLTDRQYTLGKQVEEARQLAIAITHTL